jgi:hypothetical protein
VRYLRSVLALALVITGCGGTGSQPETSGEPPSSATTGTVAAEPSPSATDSPGTTAVPGSTAVTTIPVAAPTTTRVPPEGPAAPDFALALGEGGEFRLSDEQKPVYMVFWAEW